MQVRVVLSLKEKSKELIASGILMYMSSFWLMLSYNNFSAKPYASILCSIPLLITYHINNFMSLQKIISELRKADKYLEQLRFFTTVCNI